MKCINSVIFTQQIEFGFNLWAKLGGFWSCGYKILAPDININAFLYSYAQIIHISKTTCSYSLLSYSFNLYIKTFHCI